MCQTTFTGLQTQDFAYKPPSNESRTWIEAVPKVEKLHISHVFYAQLYGKTVNFKDQFVLHTKSIWNSRTPKIVLY